MKKPHLIIATVMILILGSCTKENVEPVTMQQEDELQRGGGRNYILQMTGSQEVPPNSSEATATAIFNLRNNGTELHYRLIVNNMENLTMAHIHIGEPGVSGPAVVWLYPSSAPGQLIPGTFNGVLSSGVITSADLVGPLAGMDLSDLIDLMDSHSVYANVHSTQYPGGEIRDQF